MLLVVGLLVTAPAGGGGGGAEQAEVEALTVELREVHAATVAAHERRAADAAERSAAHVVRAEAHAARGEPLVLDVSTLTQRATQEAAEWAARMALIKESQALVLTHIEDARARDVWDVHVPYETAQGSRHGASWHACGMRPWRSGTGRWQSSSRGLRGPRRRARAESAG